MKHPVFITGVLFLLVYPSLSAANTGQYGSGWYGRIQVYGTYQDNITRAWKDENMQSDTRLALTLGGGHSRKLGSRSQLDFSGYITMNRYQDFGDIDSLATSLGVDWTFQPDPGLSSHWYELSARLIHLNFADSDIRNSYLVSADFSVNKRLTSVTTGNLGLQHVRRLPTDDDEGSAFDIVTNEIYAGADFRWSSLIFLFGEYAFRTGEFTYTLPGEPVPGNRRQAASRDFAFDRCGPTACTPWYAYRESADTHIVSAGVVFTLKRVNVELSGKYYDSRAEEQPDYDDWMIQLGAVWNF